MTKLVERVCSKGHFYGLFLPETYMWGGGGGADTPIYANEIIKFQIWSKIPVRIFFDVLFRALRFSKASLNATP